MQLVLRTLFCIGLLPCCARSVHFTC